MEMVEDLPLKGPDSVAIKSVYNPSQSPDLMRENMEEDCPARCPISATKEIVDKSMEECHISTSATASIKSQSLATDNKELPPEDPIVMPVLPNPIPNLTKRFLNDSRNFENATTFAVEVKSSYANWDLASLWHITLMYVRSLQQNSTKTDVLFKKAGINTY